MAELYTILDIAVSDLQKLFEYVSFFNHILCWYTDIDSVECMSWHLGVGILSVKFSIHLIEFLFQLRKSLCQNYKKH